MSINLSTKIKIFLIGLFVFLIMGLFFWVYSVYSDASMEMQPPEIKYDIFIPGTKEITILDSEYIFSGESLPKTIDLYGKEITIKNIEAEPSPWVKVPRGTKSIPHPTLPFSTLANFFLKVTVDFEGEEKIIGFVCSSNLYCAPEKGCTNNEFKKTCNLGDKALQIKEWREGATEEQNEMGLSGFYYLESILIEEFDYDFESNDWNYIKISYYLYEEPQGYITLD